MSVYITTNTIKVAAPGIDAATAGEKDLLLSIGQRTGQLLQTGSFNLTSAPDGGASGSAAIGPYDRTPELIGYARSSDGRVHNPPCIVPGGDGTSSTFPLQIAETFVCNSMSLDSNSISVEGFARTSIGAPEATAFSYVIYRKPNRG
jgi:hypothetical protein